MSHTICPKRLYEALGFSSLKMPPDYQCEIRNFMFMPPAYSKTPDEPVVVATLVVNPSQPLREGSRTGKMWRPVRHRIFVECPYCNAGVPFGRWDQHYGSEACRKNTIRRLTKTDPFTCAYLNEAAHQCTENIVNPSMDHFDYEALIQAIKDCRKFQFENAADLSLGGADKPMCGWAFWQSRQGGLGFTHIDWPADAARRLHANAKKYGPVNMFEEHGRLIAV